MDTWIIDSIAQSHMCISEGTINIEEHQKDTKINLDKKDEYILPRTSSGHIVVMPNEKRLDIREVKIIPTLKVNIISLLQITKRGLKVNFSMDKCVVFNGEGIVLEAEYQNGNYSFFTERDIKQRNQENQTPTTKNDKGSDGKDNEMEKAVNMEYEDKQSKIGIVQSCESKKENKATEKQQENFDIKELSTEPEDWNEIQKLPTREKLIWTEAMMEEMKAMKNNQVWEEADLPAHHRAIGCRWTFNIKRDQNNIPTKVRARLVAKGCSQKYGVNYDETFAPVVRHETIKALISLAATTNMHTRHCDISNTFLYGELEETVYMKGPEGPWKNQISKTYLLKRSIYGLKQSARAWNIKIHSSLTRLGFKPGIADRCLYINKTGNDTMFILIHVDDLLLIGPEISKIDFIINQINLEYKTKNLGPVTCYLGLYVMKTENPTVYHIHQKDKISKLLNDYDILECQPSSTPMSSDFLSTIKHTTSPDLADPEKYQKLVGSLLYLSITSRPDIHLATSILGRRVKNPTNNDMNAARRVLRYLKGTQDLHLVIGRNPNNILTSYCDADWGGEILSRKSTSGFLHFLGHSLINWSSRRQNCISLSSAKAEFVSASMAVQDIVWLLYLCEDLGIPQNKPTTLYTDSQSGMAMALSENISQRTKHIDIKYKFIKDHIVNKTLKLVYCPTTQMIADFFTKPLPKESFLKFRNCLNLEYPPSTREVYQ